MTTMPHMRSGLVIGDPYLALIGAAAGLDHIIFEGDCGAIMRALEERERSIGLIIILRSIYEECSEIKSFAEEHGDILFIHIDDPRAIEKIDPKKYYENLMAKYIGIRFELK